MSTWGSFTRWSTPTYWGSAPPGSTFTGPTVGERASRPGELWWPIYNKGVTLYYDGTWHAVRYPIATITDTYVEGTTLFFGGRTYQVTDAVRTSLLASGLVTSANFV